MMKALLCYLGASAALALTLTAGNASAQELLQEIAPAPSSYHKFFGEALAIDGDTAVMGDFNYIMEGDCGHQEHGAVQVLKKVNGVWQKAEFFRYPNNTIDYQRHGWSVAIKGNVIVAVTPGQHYGSGANQRKWAGALTVYKRPSASGTFTQAGQIFLPNPEAGDLLGWPAGMGSNGVYAAVTSDHHRSDIRIFNVQTMQYVTTISLPPQNAPWRMHITNQNILVANAGGATPSAWKLNGTQVTTVDTSMLGDFYSDSVTGQLTGDGDSVAWISQYGGFSGPYLLRTAKFNATGVVSNTVQYLPAEHDQAGNGDRPITLEEGKGIFLANGSASGTFLSAYKYVGDRYRYQGILQEGAMNFRSLAYNGTDLLIGDREPQHATTVGCDGGYAFGSIWVYRPISATAQGPGVSTSLRPWMHRATSSNGQSVATTGTTSGSYAVSAAPWTYHAASTGGAVLLYQNVNGVWDQVEQYVDSRNAGLGSGWSMFGAAVDVSSSAVVIGAPYGMNPWGQQSGNVQFVMQNNGVFRSGPYLDTIDTPNPQESGEGFGNAVVLAGNTLFVGAPGWGVPPESPNRGGSVYVYNWDGFNWMWRQQLHNSSVQAYENFGYRVAASPTGDYLMVGITGRSSNGHTGNGSIQIYRKDSSGNYVSAGEFFAPSQFGDYGNFGDAVSIGTDFGAAGSSAGTVVIFRRSGTTWAQGNTIITPGQNGFGTSLAIDGTNLVVGSPWESRVHRYTRGTTTWNRIGTLVSSSSSFGSSVDMTGSAVMIGDPFGSVLGGANGLSHVLSFSNIQ